jgi:DNA-binding MarR family transcriptional regulator
MQATTEPSAHTALSVQQPTLSDALVQLTYLISHLGTDVSRDNGVTPQQAQLLFELVHGPVGMTALTVSLRLEPSSLTGLVNRAERRGLVKRIRDEADARIVQIALTQEGAQLATSCYYALTARVEALTNDFSPADAYRFTTLIAGILEEQGLPMGRQPDVR